MKKTLSVISVSFLFLMLLQGCAGIGKNIQEDDFPYDRLGQVWESNDGYLYTVAKASSHDMQIAMDKAGMTARTQILDYFNKESATMYFTQIAKSRVKGNDPYESYVLMKMDLASNPHLHH